MSRKVNENDTRFLSGITGIPPLNVETYYFVFETELSEQARKVAERELRETPERKKEAIGELKRLLDQEKDLSYPDNEFWLVKFLRKCKFYPESAFEMAEYPDYFTNWKHTYLEDFMKAELGVTMPRRDHKGRRIVIGRINGNMENPFSINDFISGLYPLFEIFCTESDTQVNGIVVIIDLKELSLKHLKHLTPSMIQFLIRYAQYCNPLRVKGIHILNETSIIDATYTIAKNFLTEKLRDRIYFHGNDLQSLHEYIPPNCLPKFLGGTVGVDLHKIAQTADLSEKIAPIMNVVHKEITEINSYGYGKGKHQFLFLAHSVASVAQRLVDKEPWER
uniref:Putative phosphatidylinositol transfer protein sec14 n=1 Tax=Lutzomyia longipalpis TaxID=7200 RepID=A0A1B0CGM0_LUTLO